MSILELLKKRQPPTRLYRANEDGVIDLTSEGEDDVKAEADDVKIEVKTEVKTEDTTGGAAEEDAKLIECPVCLLDLAILSLEERESHVELCLLKPSTAKFIVARSPQKKKKKEEEAPRKPRKRTKPLPDFKILTLGPHKVIVDGFCYADGPSDLYFLSHFHSDHYGGLYKNWSQGILYCSEITANLAMNMFKIPPERFVVLPMNEPVEVRHGLRVTLFDANHCPGAVVFLFETNDKKVLHTGDFRVSKTIIDTFKDMYIDEIYLDTTYLNPTYSFYDQRLVINTTVKFIKDTVTSKKRKRGIFDYLSGDVGGYVIIVGSYSIGKEKIFLEIAKSLETKIFVTEKRFKTLELSGLDMSLFTTVEADCMIYVVGFDKLVDKPWLKRFSNRHIIKVRPTGWTFTRLKKLDRSVDEEESKDYYKSTIERVIGKTMTQENFEEQLRSQLNRSDTLSVPYSEHSSFKELTMLGTLLKWGKMIPTVSVENMEFQHWFRAWKEMEIPYSVVEEHYT